MEFWDSFGPVAQSILVVSSTSKSRAPVRIKPMPSSAEGGCLWRRMLRIYGSPAQPPTP